MNMLNSADFSSIPIDYSWSFTDKTLKDTTYITHGYYTYPAKFIPQLVARLIHKYSSKYDTIVDPFMGSGTTIVEGLINSRKTIGTDVNNIAFLTTKVKTTPLDDKILLREYNDLTLDLQNLNAQTNFFGKAIVQNMPEHERLDYWFLPAQKVKLGSIMSRIGSIENIDIRDFFLLAYAQILKSCSIWHPRSIKPMRSKTKKTVEPVDQFLKQTKKMIGKYMEYEALLSPEIKTSVDQFRTIQYGDARTLPCSDQNANLIITSPPYVTSYEYADLHQLASLWLGYLQELNQFRTKFIGSKQRQPKHIALKSPLAYRIIEKLGSHRKAQEVKTYFADMLESFLEMKRVLKQGGKVCIVIGNTEFKGVKILNAEVFKEQFEEIGFKMYDLIHREIPSKMLPSTRDRKTSKFVKADANQVKLAYPTEYILVMEKL